MVLSKKRKKRRLIAVKSQRRMTRYKRMTRRQTQRTVNRPMLMSLTYLSLRMRKKRDHHLRKSKKIPRVSRIPLNQSVLY